MTHFELDPPWLPPPPPEPLIGAEAATLCDDAEDPPKDPDGYAEAKEEFALGAGDPARSVTGPALAP